MRSLVAFFALVALTGLTGSVKAQTEYTNEKIEYTVELPSAVWKPISVTLSEREQTEFINGDRLEGYLKIRKESVDPTLSLSDLARHDQEQKLRYRPGYVEGKQEKFSGRYEGLTATYEYTATGKAMMGRIYYLQIDSRTVYTLHFTGLRDKLMRIRNQTDLIARSFRLK
ncbi:MAG TPA: hypothetical protein VN920_14530 [Pyrinomonadaceae bacterium]|nr:hypothetical protein [Pyrinomonadaceae bacterium]